MSAQTDIDGMLVTRRTSHFGKLHSGWNFLPSAAPTNFDKSDRDHLGVWSVQGSDLQARVARHTITTMQEAVVSTTRSHGDGDPPGEAHTFLQLHAHVSQRNFPTAEIRSGLLMRVWVSAKPEVSYQVYDGWYICRTRSVLASLTQRHDLFECQWWKCGCVGLMFLHAINLSQTNSQSY